MARIAAAEKGDFDPAVIVHFLANGTVYRSTSGGMSEAGWSAWRFPWATMTQPIVSPPYNPKRPADAKIVAVAAGQRVFVSNDFAASWSMHFELPSDASSGAVFAMSFASPTRPFRAPRPERFFARTALARTGPCGASTMRVRAR